MNISKKLSSVFTLNKRGYINSRESSWLEFKEAFNWANKSKYAKIIASFANNKGGFIVFGIKDRPKLPIGLNNDKFENLNPEEISEYLKSSFSTSIEFESEIYEFQKKDFGYIYVYEAKNKPIICIKNDRDLNDGDIYFKNGARSERIDSQNLNRIILEEKNIERKSWQSLFERISTIGVKNAALLNISTGEISDNGGTVIIDESILPDIKFIKEGCFSEKEGAPTLKLIGEIKSSAEIIEKEINLEDRFIYSTKNLGIKLGFPEKKSAHNISALTKFFNLQTDKYLHIFNISKTQKPKKYSEDTFVFLKDKLNNGEFSLDTDSKIMKKIRKKARSK